MPLSDTERAILDDTAPKAELIEEYASQTVTIDHLSERDDGETVTKVVFSTQTAVGSALAILDYFGMTAQLASEGVMGLLDRASRTAAVIVIQVPERGGHSAITEIVCDAAIWSDPALMAQVNPEGTVLGLHAGLISLARDLIKAGKEQAPTHRVLVYLTNED